MENILRLLRLGLCERVASTIRPLNRTGAFAGDVVNGSHFVREGRGIREAVRGGFAVEGMALCHAVNDFDNFVLLSLAADHRGWQHEERRDVLCSNAPLLQR
jgi:hypothetical protein